MYDGVHTMNKIFPLLISILLLTSTLTYAQHVKTSGGKYVALAKNSVYFELLGNGFLYSVNIEQALRKNLYLRLGASYGPVDNHINQRHSDPLVTIPVLINRHLKLNKTIKLEAGLGTTLVLFGDDADMYFTSSIGTKFLDAKTGQFFKVSFTPYSRNMDLLSNMKLYFGLSFGKEF